MKVLNIGSMNLDYVYSVDHIIAPGETQATYGMNVFLGGKGINQSIALAKAGVVLHLPPVIWMMQFKIILRSSLNDINDPVIFISAQMRIC